MRSVILGVLALAVSAPAFAGEPAPAQGPAAGAPAQTAPGAIAGGKVVAFDPTKKSMTVDANGQKHTIDISKSNIAGEIKEGAIVDVTFANGSATAVAVRPPPQGAAPPQGTAAQAGGAQGPAAIAGGKVIAFDPAKKLMTVDANGQKVDVMLGNAVISGQVKVGAVVDVAFANGAPSAVSVRP